VITQDGSKFTIKIKSSNQMGDSEYTLNFTGDGAQVTIPTDAPQSMGMLSLQGLLEWRLAESAD
jgi:hypothetical protein